MFSNILLLLSALLLAGVSVDGAALQCPPEHLLRPCKCTDDSVIVCKGIVGQDVLLGVFRRLGSTRVRDFILRDSKVDSIPASFLEKSKVENLEILDSSVAFLFDEVPSTRNVVRQMAIENVTFRADFRFPQLKSLQRLQALLIRDVDIPEIGKDFNLNLPDSIRGIAFLNTSTRSMDYAFVGKVKLDDIRVQNSSLHRIQRADLPYPGTAIESLFFDGNQIETLPSDLFEQMPKLIRVTFARNQIREVSEEVFGDIFDQLQEIILEDNPIKCDCQIKWLTTKSKQNKRITGKCAEPSEMTGRDIADLQEEDITDC